MDEVELSKVVKIERGQVAELMSEMRLVLAEKGGHAKYHGNLRHGYNFSVLLLCRGGKEYSCLRNRIRSMKMF